MVNAVQTLLLFYWNLFWHCRVLIYLNFPGYLILGGLNGQRKDWSVAKRAVPKAATIYPRQNAIFAKLMVAFAGNCQRVAEFIKANAAIF